MKAFVLITTVAIIATTGCSRKQHLSEFHGKSFEAAFVSQRATAATAVTEGPVTGLDSQEAAIIADSYRNSLARKSEKVAEEPILLVAPPSRERGAAALRPSVPKE